MFSVGILRSAQRLCGYVHEYGISSREFQRQYAAHFDVSCTRLIEVAQCIGWIRESADGVFELSEKGRVLIGQDTDVKRLRCQIEDVIIVTRPNWAALLSRGRNVLEVYATRNTIQCFREALLFETTSEVVEWWDRLSRYFRGVTDADRIETGRIGERLTIEYEERRTGVRPRWIAIEDNSVGYDVLSRVSAIVRTPLKIEVKTTRQQWNCAQFYLTRNEWDVLESSANAVLHLWSVANTPRTLARLSIETLANHIPLDHRNGRWQTVAVPYTVASQTEGVP